MKSNFINFKSFLFVSGSVLYLLLMQQPMLAATKNPEARARTVDAAALSSQRTSIERLRTSLKKNRGKAGESNILERLAEAEQTAAAIEFRIVHGPASQKNGKADLTGYRRYLRSSIATLTELINRFPNLAQLARAHAMRGKAYEEVGNNSSAEKEYRYLVSRYSRAPETSAALMSLADMAIANRDYGGAIKYLSNMEKREDDPRHPFALHRMAWAYYNLKQPAKALLYLEKTIDMSDGSNESLKELALLDVPLFYLEGREQKLPQYSSEHAPSYFKSLEQGTILGKMIIQYSKLLRAHALGDDLIVFKNVLVESQPDRPETFEVVTIAFEDQLNHRRFEQLVALANEVASFQKRAKNREVLEKAQKLLLDSAEEIQKLIAKNRNADGVEKLNQRLSDVYAAFTRLVDENDPRLAKIHYNLAESLFSTKQFEAATKNYRWLIGHSGTDEKTKNEATQKSIASRYEALRIHGLMPKELKAKSLASSAPAKMDDSVTEWIGWVDSRQKQGTGDENDAFYFEANRVIYANGDISRAVRRFNAFALENHKSQYAQPSAALVLDSYVAGSNWKELQELISAYLGVSEWKGSALHARVSRLNSEVAYKQLEGSYNSGDFASALNQAEQYLRSHTESKNASDALALAGNAALALKDKAKAIKYLSLLISSSPKSEAAAAALLARGTMEESSFEFELAAKDYQDWLNTPDALKKSDDKARTAVRSRVLTLFWISGNQAKLNQALRNPQICTAGLSDACDRFRALSYLLGSDRGQEMTLRAFYRSRKGPVENRSLWAALALEGSRSMAFRDRNVALHHLSANWNTLDPLFQAYLVPSLSKSIPKTFRLNRKGIWGVAPLLLNESYLAYRMEILREFENVAAKASKLPWARVRAAVLNEVASAYLDVADAMVKRAQKMNVQIDNAKLVMPFEEKGQKLRKMAFEMASNAAVEEDQLEPILAAFIESNPSQAKTLKHEQVRRPLSLDQFALEILDPENSWRNIPKACNDGGDCVIARFGAAARTGQWPQVAYLIHESREKKLVNEVQLGLMRSVAFSVMGAQAEGLKELTAVSANLSREHRQKSSLYLLMHYFRAFSKNMTMEMLKRLRESGHGKSDVALAAEKWIGG